MNKFLPFVLMMLCYTNVCNATIVSDSTCTFQSVDWSNWHTTKLNDCNNNREKYKRPLLDLLRPGLERDTVEKYLGKSDYKEGRSTDRAHYYISWDCRKEEATYMFIIHYKNNKIEKVLRSIWYICG